MNKQIDINKVKVSFGGKEIVGFSEPSGFMLRAKKVGPENFIVINMTPQPTFEIKLDPEKPVTPEDILRFEREVIAIIGIECPFQKGSRLSLCDGWVAAGHMRHEIKKEGADYQEVTVTDAFAIRFEDQWCWEVQYG